MINREDKVTLPYKHRLTHVTDNILVVANIIEQTGGFKAEDSKVLRVIENPGKFSALNPLIHLYFNDTNYIKVPLRNFHNIHIRLISASTHYDLTLIGTTTVVLHFIPQNNCEEMRKTSSIPVARNRSRPSALSLVGGDTPGEDSGESRPEVARDISSDKISETSPMSHLQATISTSLDLMEALGKTITE